MIRRLSALLSFAGLVYLVQVGGVGRALVAVLFYALAAYVVVRALPAVRQDMSALQRRIPSRARGDHL